MLIKVYYDDEPPNPRREWDGLGTMLCWHRNYDLGDNDKYAKELKRAYDPDRYDGDLNAVIEAMEKKEGAVVMLPLSLYDHSGISMSTSRSSYPFNCPWDSGWVGVIFITRAQVLKEYGWKKITKERREKLTEYLRGEVENYDDYLTNNCYGYDVEAEGEEPEVNDSCWGFLGDPEYILEELKGMYGELEKIDEDEYDGKIRGSLYGLYRVVVPEDPQGDSFKNEYDREILEVA